MEDYLRKRHGKPEPPRNEKKIPIITLDYCKALCEYEEKYSQPYLNDSICLNMKGFAKIENLEEYFNLKSLYLNGNIIKKIENIQFLMTLKCLYLQNNLIEKMEGLEGLRELDTLNLSHNYIEKIEGLEHCTCLTNLDMSRNKLKGYESVEHLSKCHSIGTVALIENELDYDLPTFEVFKKMEGLKVIHLKANPFPRNLANYRKTMVTELPNLTYLDDKPVWDEEKRRAKAFMKGGIAEERLEMVRIQDEKSARMKIYVQEFKDERARAAQRVKEKINAYKQVQVEHEKEKGILEEKRDNLVEEIKKDE